LNDYRLDLAKTMGADLTVNVSHDKLEAAMRELGLTEGFDVGLEMSGSPVALNQMMAAMVNGGKIALLGLPADTVEIDLNQAIFKGLILKGIYGREMFETWYKMIAMLDSGLDISPVLTHELPADDFQNGFDVMLSGQS